MNGDKASSGLTARQVACRKQSITVRQIKQDLLSFRCTGRVTTEEMAQCLQVATYPGKSLTIKKWNQMLRVVANKSDLCVSPLDVTAFISVLGKLVVGFVYFQCFINA